LDTDPAEIEALGAGADGYIPKTASREVMLARIASAARRLFDNPKSADFDFGKWRVEPHCGRMTRTGKKEATLSAREIEILRFFSARPFEVFSKEHLLRRFWGPEFDGQENALSQALSRLRAKLGDEARHLDTVYSAGTRFVP
jgi:DNA-binding response OmpR family regulator